MEWNLCVFYQDESKPREALISVTSFHVSDSILATESSYPDNTMRFRPAGVTDLIAAKAKYHKKCLIAYKYLSGKSKRETQKTDIAMILSALSSTMLPSVNKYSSYLTYG